jgi:hypothetical protein
LTASYPAEPWRLRGQLTASLFLVRLADVPVDLPPGWRPVRLGRYSLVCAAWVTYEPGGTLAYNELMSTLLVRRGGRLRPTITHIWVDSEASCEGGRALWAIPKQLARFEHAGARFRCGDDGGPIATATVTPRFAVPGRLPLRFHVVQALGGRTKIAPARVRGRIVLSRGSWAADPGGPLAFLAGRRPLLSIALRDFRMTFGRT